jgi:hypothetical protein
MNDKPPVTMMHESWEPPPELAGPTPRPFRWKQVGIVIPAVVVFIFFVGLGMFGATWHAADESNRLRKEGQITDATITRIWTDGASYKVAYEFPIAGKTMSGESEIPQRRWKNLQSGSHIPVKYVPGEPDYNQLAFVSDTPTPYWLPGVIFVLWIFLLYLVISSVLRERRLLRYGRAAPGMITGIKTQAPNYGYVLKYEFQLADGTLVNGKSVATVAHSRDEVIVLYDPKHPRRNRIYTIKTARVKT